MKTLYFFLIAAAISALPGRARATDDMGGAGATSGTVSGPKSEKRRIDRFTIKGSTPMPAGGAGSTTEDGKGWGTIEPRPTPTRREVPDDAGASNAPAANPDDKEL